MNLLVDNEGEARGAGRMNCRLPNWLERMVRANRPVRVNSTYKTPISYV